MGATSVAVMRGARGAELGALEVRAPRAGEAVVRVRLAGVCRTDLFAADGALGVLPGRVLGHELAGVVEGGSRYAPGTRVAAVPVVACGRCAIDARHGRTGGATCASAPERCAEGARVGVEIDGAFATRIVLPDACLVAVPEALSDREVAFVEPMAAALAIVPALARGDRAVVMGAGRIATLVARVASARLGEEVRALPPEALEQGAYDVVIETVPAALDRALAALRPGGRLVLKSRPAEQVPLDVALAVRREITLRAVRYAAFEEAIVWLVERRVAIDDLLGPTYPLARFAEALAHARRSDAPKVFLAPEDAG